MPPPEIEILQPRLGSVTAPAGCGKTQLIADALSQHNGAKPVLVLTHTNAGVAALRARLQRGSIPSSAYKVSTIDGFAMRLAAKFPLRAGLAARVLELASPNADYPAIRGAVQQLLQAGHVSDPIKSTYSRLLVDEYQDCNTTQHAIVCAIAQTLPTCVLGDPMQAIFGFRDPLVHWEQQAQVAFPPSACYRHRGDGASRGWTRWGTGFFKFAEHCRQGGLWTFVKRPRAFSGSN